MKLGLYGACLGAMASAESVHAAQLAERLGYESLWTGEHMALPDPQSPPSHRDPKHPFFDPIVGMTYLAAHTSSIRLGLGILILAQRHPVQLAKELTTLDILSNGRLIVGVGVGYLEAEYRAVGVDFRTRAARCNEHLEALRTMWIDEPPRYEGRFVTIDGIDAYPRPLTPGGPPVTVGGNSEAGVIRALRYGSGWFGFNLDPAGARTHPAPVLAPASDSRTLDPLGERRVGVPHRARSFLEGFDRVDDVQVLGGLVGDLEHLGIVRDLAQGASQAEGVPRELDRADIGQSFAPTAGGEHDQAADDRAEDRQQEGDDGDDGHRPPPSRSLTTVGDRPSPLQNEMRRNQSAMRAIVPTMTPIRSMNRMSKFRTWLISCAMTPWSSSRSSFSSSPAVTAMEACFGSRPVAKAFGAVSGMT